MPASLPILGIDTRLIGQERTGDEVVFFNLTRALLQEGKGQFRFRLFTHTKQAQKLTELRTVLECLDRDDVEFVALSMGKNRFLWNLWVLPWELWRRPVDIYHTQYIAPLWLPRQTKLVTHIHDVSFAAHPEWIAPKDRFFLNRLIPRSLRRSQLIVAPSQFTEREIEHYYPFTRGKVRVIPNAVGREWLTPVSSSEIEAVRKRFQLPERYILASGTMQPRKNIPLLIEAWAKRPAELHSVGLVLTGNRFGHHVDKRLQAVFAQEGIIFPGYVDMATLRALIAGAAAYVFPSLYEGFGLPILEAFASRTPVIASNIPPFQEVGGQAFRAFDPLSLAEMQKSLYSLLVEIEQPKTLLQAGNERLHLFSWEKSAQLLLSEYRAWFPNFSPPNSMFTKTPQTPEPAVNRKRFWRILAFVGVLALIAGVAFLVKAGFIVNKISLGENGFFENLTKSLPGAKDELIGEKEGKINVLILGMRGENVVGGGLLADTIMVVSLHPKNETDPNDKAKASIVSIPRDLYVKVPGRNEQRKINAVYALGEERGRGNGLKDMQQIVGEVTGLSIPYGAVINFEGFKDLVNTLGGISVTLEQPFQEGVQFLGTEQRCDGVMYTIPSGNYEVKRIQRKNGTYYANPKRYPLCFAKIDPTKLECGGNFKLPAGVNQLDGDKALCYARARYTSSDFDRAKRQQIVIDAIKNKALSAGTFADFGKINGLLDSLGDNVLVNLETWEMKRFFELYQKNGDATITHKVLENTEEGLLYAPPETKEAGYILLPRGDNYDRIQALFRSLP